MSPTLRRGAAASFLFHVAAGLAVFFGVPRAVPPPLEEEQAVTMEFEAPPRPVQRAETRAPTPSPQPAPTASSPTSPRDAGEADRAPPPPPPPPPNLTPPLPPGWCWSLFIPTTSCPNG